jgi:hypothetical protein
MQRKNPANQCEYAKRMERVASVLISRISGRMAPSHWEVCRITLWSFYQELAAELNERGRFHYASPAGSLHYCLPQAYKDAKATLSILEQTPLPEAPRSRRRSLADLLEQFAERESDSSEGGGNGTLPGTTC